MRGPWPDAVADLVRGHHTVTITAQLTDTNWPAGGPGTAGITLPVIGLVVDQDEQRVPQIRGTLDAPLPAEDTVRWISPLTGTLKARISVAYNGDARHLYTLSIRRRAVNRPAGTLTLDLASADAEWAATTTTVVVT